MALGALGFRYFDLVTAGNDAAAAEARRTFIGFYTNGGRAALLAAGYPSAALLPLAANRGWYANFRLAVMAAMGAASSREAEIVQALQIMPSELSRLPAWWNGAGRPVIGGRLPTSFLEALMEVEFASPQTVAGFTSAVNGYLLDPTPLVDSWVDTGGDAPPSPGSSVAPQPTTPTVATTVNTPRTPRTPPRVTGSWSVSSDGRIALPGTTVKSRAGSGATWLYVLGGTVIAAGLGYGLWLAKRRR